MDGWSIAGTYLEACNCEAICPCRQIDGAPGGLSTYGDCRFALSWFVEDGHFGDVQLDGRRVVMAGWWDDDEPHTPWRVALYIDDGADDEGPQRADAEGTGEVDAEGDVAAGSGGSIGQVGLQDG